ncbi:hypothetical protein PILCRDRAFT_809861 [Piloderma croceum F 1598]|uniref:Uncharacterized protein n=1 Tax=Piloderma croceum (strain F 1598) TaxID=765440 RepID=A0A0C3BZA2_PILCF|nr:hypothetical protein PILCRDRAFT_809861 [Piloderma croceum F 1598]
MSPNNKSSPTIWYDRYVHHRNDGAVGNQSKLTKPKITEPTSYNSSIDGLRPLARSRFLPSFRKSSNLQAIPNIEALEEVVQPLNQTYSQDMPFRSVQSGKIDHGPRRPSRPRIMTARSRSQINVHRVVGPQTYGSDRVQQSTVPVYPSSRPTKLPGTIRRYELHDIPGVPTRSSLRRREANTRRSRPQIMADRSHSPKAEIFQPNVITDHRPQLSTTIELKGKPPNQPYDTQDYILQDAARITTRPLMPRKITDHISRRPSRPRMRSRSCSRRHISRTSDQTITVGPVHREQQPTTLVHSSNMPLNQTANTDHHDISGRSVQHTAHGRYMDKAYELPQRPMGLVRSRPRRGKSRGLQHLDVEDRPRQGCMPPTKYQRPSEDLQTVSSHNWSRQMATSKTKRIKEQLAVEEHRCTETTVRPLRPLTPPDASSVMQPGQGHQRHLATDGHFQRNISSKNIQQDPSRSISDQELECDIIDLYADGYADDGEGDDGEDDRLWKEVEALAQIKPSPSLHRHISRAFSVHDVDLHPDVSRVVRSLRDGSSLDSFVLERIHSCASSRG